MRRILLLLVLPLLAAGCVERLMTIDSDPPGALVYLNGQEVGRTPWTGEFTWYGDYDVTLRMEGHETLKTHAKVVAPLWQWVPFDLLAELLPMRLTDRHRLSFNLQPTTAAEADPQAILRRAQAYRDRVGPRPPTTAPSTAPTTAPATQQGELDSNRPGPPNDSH